MTYAKEMQAIFNGLPRDERGFIEDSVEKALWEFVLNKRATNFVRECPQSCDSTLEVTFVDGSKARYENPNQVTYPSYFSTAQFE